jgi:hypothetical protein
VAAVSRADLDALGDVVLVVGADVVLVVLVVGADVVLVVGADVVLVVGADVVLVVGADVVLVVGADVVLVVGADVVLVVLVPAVPSAEAGDVSVTSPAGMSSDPANTARHARHHVPIERIRPPECFRQSGVEATRWAGRRSGIPDTVHVHARTNHRSHVRSSPGARPGGRHYGRSAS